MVDLSNTPIRDPIRALAAGYSETEVPRAHRAYDPKRYYLFRRLICLDGAYGKRLQAWRPQGRLAVLHCAPGLAVYLLVIPTFHPAGHGIARHRFGNTEALAEIAPDFN